MTVHLLPMPMLTDEGLRFEDLLHLETPEGYRTELVEGRLVVSPPAFVRHAYAVTMLHRQLLRSLPDELLAVEVPGVYHTEHNYFVPDLIVVHQEAWQRFEKGFLPEDVMLVVEVVSPSSASHDHVLKRHAYAKAGMKHYWIMDPKVKTIRILELGGESYVDKELVAAGQVWTARQPLQVTLEPATLFHE